MKALASILLWFALSTAASADDFVIILLDTSGSTAQPMRRVGRSRMEVAKEALTSVIEKIPPTTKIGLLTFRGWTYDLGPVNKTELIERINSRAIFPDGQTPLYRHMKMAADRLLQERQKQGNIGTYKLLVITDGEANGGDPALNQDGRHPEGTFKPGVLRDIVSRNIVVDVIGLDMREDHSLKTLINGSYMRGDDPASMTRAVQKAIAEVGFDAASDVSNEAFAEVAELPEPVIQGAIQALSSFPNHPISERPTAKAAAPETAPAPPTAGPTADKGGGTSGFGLLAGGVCVGLLIGLIVFIAIVRGRSGR